MSTQALKAVATAQGATERAPTIFDFLEHANVRKGITAVAGKYLRAERMLTLCVNAVKKTPRLLQCDPQSVLGAMMTSAALGLEPNTAQQAFLIPYRKRVPPPDGGRHWIDVYECQFQIGYRGFITLAYRCPHVRSLQAEAIHEGDFFERMQGSQTFPKYRKSLRDRGGLLGAFSHVHLDSGIELACVLQLKDIPKVRACSKTYSALVRAVDAAETAKKRAAAERRLA